MKHKLYFKQCNIKHPHPGFECACNGILINWFNIKMWVIRLIRKIL